MKRLLLIIAILLLITTTACAKTGDAGRFVVVEDQNQTNGPWVIVADKETKVMYAVSRGIGNEGTFTMLVQPDGEPLLWEGETNERSD